jgi:hypothetical protein
MAQVAGFCSIGRARQATEIQEILRSFAMTAD